MTFGCGHRGLPASLECIDTCVCVTCMDGCMDYSITCNSLHIAISMDLALAKSARRLNSSGHIGRVSNASMPQQRIEEHIKTHPIRFPENITYLNMLHVCMYCKKSSRETRAAGFTGQQLLQLCALLLQHLEGTQSTHFFLSKPDI